MRISDEVLKQVVFDSGDWASMRELCKNHEQYPVPLLGKTSIGEDTWMHIPGSLSGQITPPDNWTSVSSWKKNELRKVCLLYGFIDLLYRMGILHREITDMCLSVPCPAAVSALFPFVGIERRQPFFPAVPCRQFVRFCCDKGPFCTDLKTALCSRYGANDYLSFIMIFSGATFSVI